MPDTARQSLAHLLLTCALLALGLPAAAWAAGDEAVVATWRQRIYTDTGVESRALQTGAELEGGQQRPHVLPVALPEACEYFCQPARKLVGWDTIYVDLRLPESFPDDALIYLWIKDWDSQWYQALADRPGRKTGAVTVAVPLSGPAATAAWQPSRHFRPWHQVSPNQIDELGVKFASPTGKSLDFKGEVLLDGVRLGRLDELERPPATIRDFRILSTRAQVGQTLELAVELTHAYHDPFSRTSVDISALVTGPEGEERLLKAFYFEDFLFDEESDQTELVPYGFPQFRVRHTPLKPGPHTIRITGSIDGVELALPPVTIEVAEAEAGWKGFLRPAAEDNRLLAFSATGEDFNGIGINVRSPYDTRYMEAFAFSDWRPYNLTMYKHLFEKYEKAGINVVEVWMSPWWLALEWMPDAPGNHGVGHYNQNRAWKLDRLFEWAGQHNIYLILVFNNHGKFSTWCDPDWGRNPYNTERGGTLANPQLYFTDPIARASTRQLLDYITARWGHEPNLLAWKLFTEINLTGNGNGWYKDAAVREWHREMGQYLKQVDPNQHMVTTHWSTSYAVVNRDLATIDELDMLTLDIYYDGTGANRLWQFMEQTVAFSEGVKKPCLISEFGGSPWADSLDHIRNQLHIGLWSGWFGVMATPPCFWWFPLVEEQNLYGDYRGLANFVDGESRLKAERGPRRVLTGTHLMQMELKRGEDRLLWIFDTDYFFAGDLNRVADSYTEQSVRLTNLKPGKYRLEYWNPISGERILYDTYTVADDGRADLTLPPFTKDIAVKLILEVADESTE